MRMSNPAVRIHGYEDDEVLMEYFIDPHTSRIPH